MNQELNLPSQLPDGFTRTPPDGLTSARAAELMAGGHRNIISDDGSKTTAEILRSNLLTWFNLLNVVLALCLLAVGSYKNMLFILIIFSNAFIGTVQELRARNTIRRLQLLNAPSVHVLRDGRECTVKPAELVRGDLVILRAGDQVVADALVFSGSGHAMESLLTGESDAVPKSENDWLYSGSYITEGRITAQLVWVGDESYAGRLMKEARKTERPKSVLMTELNRLIRFDSIILIPMGVLLFLKQFFLNRNPLPDSVTSSVAAMIGMIPEGLILLTSVAMAVGVVKLGRRNTLVQELYGIETLARVDVLCLDKTGTITTGEMTLEVMEPEETSAEEMKAALARFLGAFDDDSSTLNALRRVVDPLQSSVTATLPFSSARKKSAASFADGTVLILGAPEFVLGSVFPEKLRQRVNTYAAEGKRVTVLAESRGRIVNEELPPVSRILGLCVLSDTLRSNAEETVRYFREQGVALKVISGDHPLTVSRVAKQAGIDGWDRYVDVSSLKTEEELQAACRDCTVFGRVTPDRKKELVLILKQQGHTVAMTGDGVNDIPALKAADCSVAMAGGADAARHAAQLTLMDSDFSHMPAVVLEGRRVINNITRAASLFLTKTLFSFGLGLLTLLFTDAYPYDPIQLTLISTLTVGIPSFFLALEPNNERITGNFLKTVLQRAIPGGAAVAVCASVSMLFIRAGWPVALCKTLATYVAGAVGLMVLLRSCLPLNRNRTVIVSVMSAAFVLAALILGPVFSLVPLTGPAWLLLAGLILFSFTVIVFGSKLLKKRQTNSNFPHIN